MPIYVVKSGDSLSAIAQRHGFNSWQSLYHHPSNESFRRKRPDPNHIRPGDRINIPKAITKKTDTLLVAIHCWQGKKPTRGFELCARTVSQSSTQDKTIVRHTRTKTDFRELCEELVGLGSIAEFHVYSHFGMDGPIFQDGQFLLSEMMGDTGTKLPKMTWTEDSHATFYGCNAGLSPWIIQFMANQNVTVLGSAGFSLFSKRPKQFYPFDGDPNSTPCYLDCFPGMTELLAKKYPHTRPDNFLEDVWRKATVLPEWIEARTKHLPPKRMRRFDPS